MWNKQTIVALGSNLHKIYMFWNFFLKIGLLLSDTVPRGELQITMMAEQKNTPSKLTQKKQK